ncbi:GNAT family N-acetyltransferase [Paenibacillus sp. BC26]|uniref:GNAT family N-acetyltransferase n=1 Tax=Paenibacillus sp. BC26 TaxID=1881032 RepID=UPI0008F343A3|nr:GNAT family N-acetyltransferase [Paenibacillus sp. BC26]SFT27190.1 ribosomal-protein-alanine N-acetyltransferase [Paenibacillus sp. BC26]
MSSESLFPSFPTLYTQRLVLRQMNAADAGDIYAFYSDPLVTKHLDWYGPSSVEDTRVLIDSWNEAYEDKKLIPWGISLNSTRQFVGTLMLMPIRGHFNEAPYFPLTLGFDLKPECWNKGIMSEALRSVLDFNRKHIGHHRIQAEVLPENAASLKVLKKLGFQEEGVLRQYLLHDVTKRFLDVVMLALLLS